MKKDHIVLPKYRWWIVILTCVLILAVGSCVIVGIWLSDKDASTKPDDTSHSTTSTSMTTSTGTSTTVQTTTLTTTPSSTSTTVTTTTTTTTRPAVDDTGRPEKVIKIYDARDDFKSPTYEQKTFRDNLTGTTMPYCLFLPEDYTASKKYPVILFLHGAGERGSDNRSQVRGMTRMHPTNGDLVNNAIIICPQCPANGWWDVDRYSYGDQKGSLGVAVRLLQNIQTAYSCDSDRIYAMGLSMGGYGTWSLLTRYSDVFAAGVPMCGWGDTSQGAVLANIPIWIYHGTSDPTVSFSQSQAMYNAIINAGGKKVLFTKLAGYAHNCWDYAMSDREMFCWLFAQNKSKNPDGSYEHIPYFKVVDAKGNIVISDKDTCKAEFDQNDIEYRSLKLTLTDEGVAKLKSAYAKNNGERFTFYVGNQKIFEYTATKEPIDNILYLNEVFKMSTCFRLYTNLNAIYS